MFLAQKEPESLLGVGCFLPASLTFYAIWASFSGREHTAALHLQALKKHFERVSDSNQLVTEQMQRKRVAVAVCAKKYHSNKMRVFCKLLKRACLRLQNPQRLKLVFALNFDWFVIYQIKIG